MIAIGKGISLVVLLMFGGTWMRQMAPTAPATRKGKKMEKIQPIEPIKLTPEQTLGGLVRRCEVCLRKQGIRLRIRLDFDDDYDEKCSEKLGDLVESMFNGEAARKLKEYENKN